jgi:dihydrofolate reductase
MRILYAFVVMTVDGFYEGPEGEFDWPNVDDEFNQYSVANLNDTGIIIFGRVTYEGMADYWTSPAALEGDPIITPLMNEIPKAVVSSTLHEATWNNTILIDGDVAREISKLKSQPGKSIGIFGSPNLTFSLIEMGLIDELRLMIHPVALGSGKPIFTMMTGRLTFDLLRTTIFESGNVLLTYRPGRPTSAIQS